MPRPNLAERFWAKVNKQGPADCWPWTASAANGYGYISVGGRKTTPAHRVSYELNVGPIPEGLHIDHLCRNTRCVNPAHLEPVTCKENVIRGHIARGTRSTVVRKGHLGGIAQGKRTHCAKNHPYDEANTYWNRRPSDGRLRRSCRACSAIASSEYEKRRAAKAGAR